MIYILFGTVCILFGVFTVLAGYRARWLSMMIMGVLTEMLGMVILFYGLWI